MASEFQKTWQIALEAEGELFKSLAEKEPTFAGISHYLSLLRAACQNAILQDFESARSTGVEARLWDAHLKVNNRFRKLLSRVREENGKKKKPVEKRKLEKHYLDFIKSSQRFYRGYIQQLSSHFGGIPELEKVARKFNFDNLSAQPAIQASEDIRTRVLQSCHSTLIRLGDLSRYRETELVSKDRNWGPAIGYYDLAIVIYPASGASHNQLAVIALADGNHLRATYHLYRALSAQDPHPSARGNLEIELRKVMNAWAKKELIRPEDAGIPGRALVPWFVYLHAQCYKGTDFPEHDELESEVLSQLAVDLKERSLEGTLQKFCVVNIAAEDFARKRSNEESVSNACLFFQRINVKTFFTLLQILLAELERSAVDDSKDEKPKPDKVTVVARRILPTLRNYSSWLLTVSPLLVAYKEEKDTPLSVQITEFWKIYANTLTILALTFEVVHLPEIDYLLEEDEETLGFAPLDQEATCRRYLDSSGRRKPRMHDEGVERSHPNIEMLYRIREFVIDGLDLVVGNKIPIALVDDNDKKSFIYKEEGLPSQFFASPSGHHHTLSSTSIEREDIPRAVQDPSHTAESRSAFDGSQISANMHRLVEDVEKLVESDTCESAPTVPEQPAFLSGSQLPTPSGNLFGSDRDSTFPDDSMPPPRNTPMAPPGLGPPMASNVALARTPSSQSYTPLPSIPNFSNIWNTGLPGDSLSLQGPPPGLTQQPNPMYGQRNITSPPGLHSPQDPSSSAARDLMLRQQQLIMAQNQYPNSLNASSGPISSPWNSPSNLPHPHSSRLSWENVNSPPPSSPFGVSAPMSSNLPFASWANDAFIASHGQSHLPPSSSVPSGYNSPGFSTSRRSGAQLGAIGETPPCGQGG